MPPATTSKDHNPPRENPFINIAFNLLIPIYLLNNLEKHLVKFDFIKEIIGDNGPLLALVIALGFPIVYASWDYLKYRRKNLLSFLGIVNTLFTGVLALFHLSPIWFAVKEAFFPLLLGAAVFWTSFTETPFIKIMLTKGQIVDFDLIFSIIKEKAKEIPFADMIRKANHLFTISFAMSSVLNYWLARKIIIDAPPGLTLSEQTSVRNEQIASMYGWSFLVIALPLMIFTLFIMFYVFKEIQKLTGLELNQIIRDPQKKPESSEPSEPTDTSES